MHLSTVETVLEYQVQSPTHFCFNLEAAHWPTQQILSEKLAISSGVTPRAFTDPRSGNRFLRFDAQPGPLLVNYKAEVETHTLEPDTTVVFAQNGIPWWYGVGRKAPDLSSLDPGG